MENKADLLTQILSYVTVECLFVPLFYFLTDDSDRAESICAKGLVRHFEKHTSFVCLKGMACFLK